MEDAIVLKYQVKDGEFQRAGEVSSDVKHKLKQMGVPANIVRKIAIAMYEGEVNMVIHANGGDITVEITPEQIKMILADVGPGIPDVEKAMTASKICSVCPAGKWDRICFCHASTRKLRSSSWMIES